MCWARAQAASAAARTAIDRMREGDVVSIITYDTRSDVVAPPTVIDSGSRRRLAAAIDEIVSGFLYLTPLALLLAVGGGLFLVSRYVRPIRDLDRYVVWDYVERRRSILS